MHSQDSPRGIGEVVKLLLLLSAVVAAVIAVLDLVMPFASHRQVVQFA
jgi:hypothetical protein